jgi:hypothetical protein
VIQTDLMRVQTTELQTAEAFRRAPDMAVDRPLDCEVMPQLIAREYFDAIDELGSPVAPATVGALRLVPGRTVDAETINLFSAAFRFEVDSSRPMVGSQCESIDPSKVSTLDLRVPNGQWIALDPAKDGEVLVSVSFLNPPAIQPLRQLRVQATKPAWIYVPNTGRGTDWRLRIQTAGADIVRICSTARVQLTLRPTNVYSAEGASFTFGRGWASVDDPSASGGRGAKVASGTRTPSGAYGTEFTPAPGTYDIWYRVRVVSNRGTVPQLICTLTDVSANVYMASETFKPSQVSSTYKWILVASNVTPTSGHLMRFQINTAAELSTDWYIDEAIMVAAGSPPGT